MANRWDNQGPPAPKPFDYIPFAREVKTAPPAGHQRFERELLTGHLTGTITALTPLHVASGTLELTKRVAPHLAAASPLIKAFVRSGGVRVIPGSTLKGAVRSVVEAITPSTVGKVGRRTRLPQALHEPTGLKKQEPPARNPLSPADRLFGVMDYLGQVRFSDARQQGDSAILVRMPALFAPRAQEVRGRKFYKHGRPAQGNTPTEAAPVGEQFVFRCDFDNLSTAELGVLLIALGQGEPALHLKLGGGKPACYGSVAIGLTTFKLRQAIVEDYLAWEGAEEEVTPTRFVTAALVDQELLLPQQLRALNETLRYRNDRDCSPGIY